MFLFRLMRIKGFKEKDSEEASSEKKIDTFEYSSIEWRPLNYIELDKDQSNNVAEVLTSLEDLDDVQNIFTNANLKNLQ